MPNLNDLVHHLRDQGRHRGIHLSTREEHCCRNISAGTLPQSKVARNEVALPERPLDVERLSKYAQNPVHACTFLCAPLSFLGLDAPQLSP